MSTPTKYSYGEVISAALEQNGWIVETITEVHPGGNGYVPHGVVLVKRLTCPFPERPYAVANYNVRADGILFEAGDYDLTKAQADAYFGKRAWLE